jgi:hypothetical protein
MRLEKKYNAALAFFLLAPLPLIAMDIPWAATTRETIAMRLTVAAIIGSFAGASIVVGASEPLRWVVSGAQAQSQLPHEPSDGQMPRGHNIPPGVSGSFNFGQRSGNNYQTYINQTLKKLKLTDAVDAELLAKLPREKPLTIQSVGSPS